MLWAIKCSKHLSMNKWGHGLGDEIPRNVNQDGARKWFPPDGGENGLLGQFYLSVCLRSYASNSRNPETLSPEEFLPIRVSHKAVPKAALAWWQVRPQSCAQTLDLEGGKGTWRDAGPFLGSCTTSILPSVSVRWEPRSHRSETWQGSSRFVLPRPWGGDRSAGPPVPPLLLHTLIPSPSSPSKLLISVKYSTRS